MREQDDPGDDLDVNMAILSTFLNTTLQAAVHLGQDYEANLRSVKYHLWNSVAQFFNETGKVISERPEITGVNTIISKNFRGCRQAYCAAKLIRSPTPKPTSSPTQCSVW